MSDYFNDMVGQEGLKRKLSFYLDAFKETRIMPFLLFAGARGSGKSEFAKATCRYLTKPDGSTRPMLEINCSAIKNNKVFFENVYLNMIAGKDISVFFEEFHNCPNDLSQALLTLCNSGPDPIREFQYQESLCTFDRRHVSMFFATTESDAIFTPLRERFEVVDFAQYSPEDLKKILVKNCPDQIFEDDILDVIVQHVRDNPRFCVKMAESIVTYCCKNHKATFGKADWKSLCHSLDILPYGLTNTEMQVLKELNARGACSLGMLVAATGMSRSALQKDTESFLLRKSFMRIDGQRKITEKGQNVLAMVA